ncbi:MAG: ubiquinol-cytochrome C chaperone [Alphaproteobacteria bacterium]|nr:ubiquinol-cytochrome C chaperone [Alphaproteobacteria bacterium]
MIFGLFRRRTPPQVIATYTAIVAQARQPHFYASLDVPDTFDGRFELVILHAILVLERLQERIGDRTAFSLGSFSICFSRTWTVPCAEMGVGDVTVPKKVKKMAEAFYGRAAVYSQALDDGAQTLAQTVERNLFADDPRPAA